MCIVNNGLIVIKMNKLKSILRSDEQNIIKINKLDSSKFPLLVSRIAQAIAEGKKSAPFSLAEITKLQSILSLSEQVEVESLVGSIVNILCALAYHRISPKSAETALAGLSLDADKISGFIKAWESYAAAIIERFQNTSILPKVNYMSYNVSLETSTAQTAEEKEVKGLLHMGLSNDGGNESLDIEFTHSQLTEFYHKLENIVTQLDDLRNES